MTPPQPPSGTSSGSSRVEDYPHGYRLVERTLPDGRVELDYIALTVEDVLHPQENDEIPVRGIHELDCRHLTNVFWSRPLTPPITYVAADWLTDFGVAEVKKVSPDIAVYVGMTQQPDMESGTFLLPEWGGRCVLAVEVVSPDRRVNDVVHKLRLYHLAGVPFYVIVDQEKEGGPRSLLAYRHGDDEYVPIPLNAQGRVYVEPVKLFLGMRDGRVACYDPETGRELGDYVKLAQDLDAADRLIQEQEQVIENGILENRELRRAERAAAERARQAEEQAREAAKAREDAERQARDQTQLRAQAELQIQELQALLRRLQGGPTE
jgi:Uma2 family endonuclease